MPATRRACLLTRKMLFRKPLRPLLIGLPGKVSITRVGIRHAGDFYGIVDAIFRPIWEERDMVLGNQTPRSKLNPAIRMMANDFFDRLQVAGTVRGRRLSVLFSRRYGPRNYIVKVDGKPAGFFCIRRLSTGSWDFGPFGVLESQRGKGIGTAIVERVKELVKEEGGRHIVSGIVVRQTHDQLLSLGFHEEQQTWYMGLDL
ncbi:MAG: GNAT family N-acetyltransferase [Nitrososphaerota archaeon]|jgi:GNAT superfamily N-acetyltransferase|nr:GNAT family N-acetyltransferase [Nitrososphaerota archaeon]